MNPPLKSFMAVARFKDGVTPEDIRAVVPAEQPRVTELEAHGQIGTIRVAMPKRTVFIEFFDDSEESAQANLDSLPLGALWDADLYETTPPAGVTP